MIPTTHREYAEDAFDLRNGCGFSFGNGCSGRERAQPLRRQDGRQARSRTREDGAKGLRDEHAQGFRRRPARAACARRAARRTRRRAGGGTAGDRRRARPRRSLATTGPAGAADRGAAANGRLVLEERYVSSSTAAARRRCTCSSTSTANRAIAARRWSTCRIYEKAGLELSPGELPDYLPAVLEYLSCRRLRGRVDARRLCAHRAQGRQALAERGSPYAAVLAPCCIAQLPGIDWSKGGRDRRRPEPPIDEEWADAPAFAPPAAEAARRR